MPSDAEKNGIVEELREIITKVFQQTMTLLLNKEISISKKEVALLTAQDTLTALESNTVVIHYTINTKDGHNGLVVTNIPTATVMVDLLLLGEGKQKDEISDEDMEGLKEVIGQSLSSVSESISKNWGGDIKVEHLSAIQVLSAEGVEKLKAIIDNTSFYRLDFTLGINDIHSGDVSLFFAESFIDELAEEEKIKRDEDSPSHTDQPTIAETESTAPASLGEQKAPQAAQEAQPRNIDLIMEIELPIYVRIGSAKMLLQDVLQLTSGSVIELDRDVNEPVELIVNDKIIAYGEVVVVDSNFALRITEIASRAERIKQLK